MSLFFSCLSYLAPSVTRVATCVSHVLLDRLQKKERLLLSRAISHARGHLRVSRFARPTTEKRETARSLGDEQRNKNKKKNIESRCFCLSHVRFFFLPGSCPVPTDSVRCCEIFLALGRCLDKHKRAFSLVEQCRVTSWPCPYIKGYVHLSYQLPSTSDRKTFWGVSMISIDSVVYKWILTQKMKFADGELLLWGFMAFLFALACVFLGRPPRRRRGKGKRRKHRKHPGTKRVIFVVCFVVRLTFIQKCVW